MSIPDRFREMIDRMMRTTDKGTLSWTQLSQYSYIHSFEKWSVRVTDSGRPDETEYEVSLINDEGATVDSFAIEQGELDFDTIRVMWMAARRHALGGATALGEIQTALRQIEEADEEADEEAYKKADDAPSE